MAELSSKDLKKNLFIAISEVAILLGLLWILCPPAFETTDDMTIMNMVSGFYTGVPTFQTIYGTFFWGKLLTILYSLTGNIPWYTVILMILIFVSLVDICFALETVLSRFGKTTIAGIAFFVLLFFSVFCYFSSAFQYTAVAALCGTAAIINIYAVNDLKDKHWRVANYIMTFILYFFAYNIRVDVGYLSLAGCFLALFMNRIVLQRIKNKKVIIYLSLIVIVVLSSYGLNSIYEYTNEISEFREYNNERVAYIDYPYIGYNENPELYESIGWSETLASLVRSWYFLDEAVTTDAFRVLNDARGTQDFNIQEALQQMIRWNMNLVNEGFEIQISEEVHLQILCWFLGVFLSSIYCIKKKKWKNIFEIWGYFISFAVIEMYFIYQERLPLRVIESLIYIFMIPGIFSIIMACDAQKNLKKQYITAFIGIAIAAVIFYPEGMWNKVYSMTNSESVELREQTRTVLEDYAINHKDNIYIYEFLWDINTDPFIIYPDGKPKNLFPMGGWDTYLPPYYEKLNNNGLTALYPENYFEDNIFWITPYEELENALFYRYIQELYPGSYCDKVDETEYFIVYKFVR